MKVLYKIILCAAIIAGLIFAFILYRASGNEAQTNARYAPQGQLLDIEGTQVHALVMGQGPDLVLIHGASGNARDMTFALAPRLAEQYRVIVFDRPGQGFTNEVHPKRGDTIIEQAALLSKAASALGADKPIVMGHSYGGSVALAWAVTQPDHISAVIPVSAPSTPYEPKPTGFRKRTTTWWGKLFVVPTMTAFVPQDLVESTLSSIFHPQIMPDGYAEHVGVNLALRRKSLHANSRQTNKLGYELDVIHKDYGTISVPTEIVHGTDDQTVNFDLHAKNLVTEIPDAVLTNLTGVGHMPHQVSTDDLIAAIDRAANRAGLR